MFAAIKYEIQFVATWLGMSIFQQHCCCTNASSVYLFNTIFTFHNSSPCGEGFFRLWTVGVAVVIRMRNPALGHWVLSPSKRLYFPFNASHFATGYCMQLLSFVSCTLSGLVFLVIFLATWISGKRCLGSLSEATTLKSTQQIKASTSHTQNSLCVLRSQLL